MTRTEPFLVESIYHIYNRGVEKRKVFLDTSDRKRFVALLAHSLPQADRPSYSLAGRYKDRPYGSSLVDVLSYCLMPNHFHLLLQEKRRGGISKYMQRLMNSYTKYFNVRNDRSGPLFSGRFKSVHVDGDEQFVHVARYIHLNPFVAGLIKDPLARSWSSLSEYIGSEKEDGVCNTQLLNEQMSGEEQRRFILDNADYARELSEVEHLLIDHE